MQNNRGKHRLFWAIVCLAIAVAAVLGLLRFSKLSKLTSSNQPGLYHVLYFDDGDTLVVDMNGHPETVRFIGVDTPETHKPNVPVQCYGPEASAYTKKLVGSQKVRLVADPLDTNRDRYGRLLRYIYLPDGRLVDQILITQGYGLAYTFFPFSKKAEFTADEQAARQAKHGLWSKCQVVIDKIGRHTNPAE